MSAQIFLDDINKLTVSNLKSLISKHKWNPSGIRLKPEFQKFILQSSYNDVQEAGVSQLEKLIK